MSDIAVARTNAAVESTARQSDGAYIGPADWTNWESDPLLRPFGRGTDESWSTSLREDALEYIARVALFAPTWSTAHVRIFDFDRISDSEFVEASPTPVSVARTHSNLYEIRRLTGLNWSRLADLLNVDRRTVHNWVKGGDVRESNRHHVAESLKVLRVADRGSAELNAAALEEPSASGKTAFAWIRAGQYVMARSCLGHGAPRSPTAAPKHDLASRTGEFRSMVIHSGADGMETNEPLPYEPMPKSRQRRLDRE